MPRLVTRYASALILTIRLSDASDAPIASIPFNDADLQVAWLNSSSSHWTVVTLSSGTVGQFVSNGWAEVGNGIYQYCLPNVAIVPGDRTQIRVTYASHPPLYDAIDAVIGEWSNVEREQIRYVIGIDGTATAPTSATSHLVVTIRPTVVIDANTPIVNEGLTFAITALDDFDDDADVEPIGPIRIDTDLDLLRSSNPPRLRFGATQRLGSRLGTVKFIGGAYAEAVSGEPTQFDVYITLAKSELNRAPGLYSWDVEAVFPSGDVRTVVDGTLTLKASMGDNEARDPLNP